MMMNNNNLAALVDAYRAQVANRATNYQPNIVGNNGGSPSPYGNPIIGSDGLAIQPYAPINGDRYYNQLGREHIYLPRTDAMSMGGLHSDETRQGYQGTLNANIADDEYAQLLSIINSLPRGDFGNL